MGYWERCSAIRLRDIWKGCDRLKGTLYTEEEDRRLIELREADFTNREISDRMEGRTVDSVIGRLQRLRSRRKVL